MNSFTANLYESNITALQKFNPQLLQLLTSLKEERYRTEPARSGFLTLIYGHKGQEFYLHSKFKPEEEALKLVQKVDLKADHIIVFGLGLGYHLELLLTLKAKNSRLLLVEPDLEIVKHSLKTMDWQGLLSRHDFFYCFGSDLNLLATVIGQTVDVITLDRVEWVELASETRLLQAYFSTARQKIDSEIKTLLYDFKTRLAEDAMVPRNILKNIRGLLNSRPLKALKNKFAGKPGVIVSAGPSLDRNILYLKKIRDRAVIICVDTALKPLLKRGIHPHFTVTADPSYKNYLHLQGTERDIRYFILADTGVAAQVYADFHSHLFSVSLGKPILKMIESNMGELGELEAWGSVISLTLNFAIYLGLEPIVFMGQDFAFSGLRNHCRGTSWEENVMEYTRDLDHIQRTEKQGISGIAKILEIPDIYGHKTMSSDRLLLYKNYLTKSLTSYPAKRFINASEGGVLTEIETMPLVEVLKTWVYPGSPIDFSKLFTIPTLGNPQSKKQLLTFFKGKVNFFKKYARKIAEKIATLNALENMGSESLKSIIQETEKLKDQLYTNPHNGEIVEMWTQGPIYHFLKRLAKVEKPATGFNDAYGKELGVLFRDYFLQLSPTLSSIISSFEDSINDLQ